MNGHIGKPLSRATLADALAELQNTAPETGSNAEARNEQPESSDRVSVDTQVLELLRTELKGAAAGVVREFMVEMQTIRDQFVSELAQEFPRPDMIAQNAHRLFGAARTLGALDLAQKLTEFQKLQPRESSVFEAQSAVALERLIAETDDALEHLETFFQARLVGAEAGA